MQCPQNRAHKTQAIGDYWCCLDCEWDNLPSRPGANLSVQVVRIGSRLYVSPPCYDDLYQYCRSLEPTMPSTLTYMWGLEIIKTEYLPCETPEHASVYFGMCLSTSPMEWLDADGNWHKYPICLLCGSGCRFSFFP